MMYSKMCMVCWKVCQDFFDFFPPFGCFWEVRVSHRAMGAIQGEGQIPKTSEMISLKSFAFEMIEWVCRKRK